VSCARQDEYAGCASTGRWVMLMCDSIPPKSCETCYVIHVRDVPKDGVNAWYPFQPHCEISQPLWRRLRVIVMGSRPSVGNRSNQCSKEDQSNDCTPKESMVGGDLELSLLLGYETCPLYKGCYQFNGWCVCLARLDNIIAPLSDIIHYQA
jgi:hypothetical protein